MLMSPYTYLLTVVFISLGSSVILSTHKRLACRNMFLSSWSSRGSEYASVLLDLWKSKSSRSIFIYSIAQAVKSFLIVGNGSAPSPLGRQTSNTRTWQRLEWTYPNGFVIPMASTSAT